VNARIAIEVARDLFILAILATIAFLLGNGYYKSFRSGVLTINGRTSRGDKEPISYWIGMAVGTFAFLFVVSATAVMAFLVCVGLSGTSK
jgi:hypothetical protein